MPFYRETSDGLEMGNDEKSHPIAGWLSHFLGFGLFKRIGHGS